MKAIDLCKMSSKVSYKNGPLKMKHRMSINQSEFSHTYDNYSQSVITQTQNGTGCEYNRKEKSLGELCRRFLSIYGKSQKDFLLLDQCTKEL